MRVRASRPGVMRLVGVRMLRGSNTKSWTVVRSWLVVSHGVGICARTGKLWVMATGGGVVNKRFVLLLQRRPTLLAREKQKARSMMPT